MKWLDGKTIHLWLKKDSYIADVKEKIYEKNGVNLDLQRLMYSGHQLKDYLTLFNYNINNECTLHLSLRLRGD